MKVRQIALLAALAALVSTAVASAGQAGAGVAITQCGQVVQTNAYLTLHLYCPGQDAVVVGASGITIDLRGFTLRGDRTPIHEGIRDNGFDQVTIKNGILRNFEDGVMAYNGADKVRLSNLLTSGNLFNGLDVAGTSLSVKSSTASGNGSAGIVVAGDLAKIQSFSASGNHDGIDVFGNSATIQSSTASGNRGYGIAVVTGNSDKIQSSTASGNGSDGIFVAGDAAVIKANRAEANGFAGGASDLSGLGIDVTGSAPIGKNVARGNDELAQCSPALLC
ncbi:MAG: right-handed parallel beta-helix repeat-containing protein [Verrucomicrobiota bacterium]